MRQRAFIQVNGAPGAGKTAFVEALLHRLGEIVICVRSRRDDSLRAPEEASPKDDQELRRCRDAGASATALYRFPSGHAGHDAFFMTDFMQDYSTAVVIEGDCPVEYVDLSVFVSRPLPPGQPFLRRLKRDHAAAHAASLDAVERALASPGVLAGLLTRGLGEPSLEKALSDPRIMEQTRAKLGAELAKLRAAPPPKATEHWMLAAGLEGIERAQLVVANIEEDGERASADLLLQDVGRIRKDAAVHKDVVGLRGSKLPITAVVANVADPKDAGLKKAVDRVKRAVRRAR